mmetsp:Transcript_8614/g.21345  ORF Transcript_8614/g.21345 Transcript_8614/m.21345 type:complete len:366 (+) Transcript_8614:2-1099(+)
MQADPPARAVGGRVLRGGGGLSENRDEDRADLGDDSVEAGLGQERWAQLAGPSALFAPPRHRFGLLMEREDCMFDPRLLSSAALAAVRQELDLDASRHDVAGEEPGPSGGAVLSGGLNLADDDEDDDLFAFRKPTQLTASAVSLAPSRTVAAPQSFGSGRPRGQARPQAKRAHVDPAFSAAEASGLTMAQRLCTEREVSLAAAAAAFGPSAPSPASESSGDAADSAQRRGPAAGVISIVVHGARDLLNCGLLRDSDTYVLVEVEGQRQRSPVVQGSVAPDWEWTAHFNVYGSSGMKLRFSVWHEGLLQDSFLGSCFVSVAELCDRGGRMSLLLQGVDHGAIEVFGRVEWFGDSLSAAEPGHKVRT